MNNKKYPKWIDEFAKAFHNAFTKMIPITWGPVNADSVISFLNGAFLSKVHQAIIEIKNQGYKIEEVAKTFSCPSTIRVALPFLIWEYQGSEPKNKAQFKEVAEYMVEVLSCLAKKDIFAYESNIAHTDKEIEDILNKTDWKSGNKEAARELGKLYNSVASLGFSLYGDFFPQDSHEVYGPYDASKKFGKDTILIIKHFPKIKPIEIWPEIKKLKYSNVKIFQIYKNVQFRCETIGMHSIYEGDIINNLLSYFVVVDSIPQNSIEKIKELSDYFAKVATEQSIVYEKLSKEERKIKILEWDCYQFINFFKLAEMDWRPTKEMLEAVKDKEVGDRYELEKFPSFEEYVQSPEHEIYWLKDLYK